jgi:hypothetical protein
MHLLLMKVCLVGINVYVDMLSLDMTRHVGFVFQVLS